VNTYYQCLPAFFHVDPAHTGLQEQFQDAKVLIFKKRRRKNSRRLKGHRQVSDLGQLAA
jgi:hypothetical protein